jgi:hypothetical protein
VLGSFLLQRARGRAKDWLVVLAIERERKEEYEPNGLGNLDVVGCVERVVDHDKVSRGKGEDADEYRAEPEDARGEEEVVVAAEKER